MRRTAVILVVVALLGASGCIRKTTRLGAGEDVDVCDGWREIDGFDEPALSEPDEIVQWADGVLRVIKRVDLDKQVDDEPVPKATISALLDVGVAVSDYRDEIRDADDDPSAVRAATQRLTASAYGEASRVVSTFVDRRCERAS